MSDYDPVGTFVQETLEQLYEADLSPFWQGRIRGLCGLYRSLSFERVHAVNTARCRRWHEDSTEWTGADWATAMGGECGEALNIVKKLRRVECGMERGPNDPPELELLAMLADELADVFLYLDLLAWHYGVDLPLAIIGKFNRVSERQGFPERLPWPPGFGLPVGEVVDEP